ncbi:MAG: NAD(+) synthase [Ruminococcaceae bacterium]|nr:NAD(+) synthase [Oscillospiraceae bacterium]
MKNGFFKLAAALPRVRVADPRHNTDEMLRLTHEASEAGAALILFPQLSITGYTCGDLFHSTALLRAALKELERYLSATSSLSILSLVGLPMILEGRTRICTAVCHQGRLLGIVAKSRSDGGEERQFSFGALEGVMTLNGQAVPYGTDLLFRAENLPSFSFAVEMGETLTDPLSSASRYATEGATLLCNPAASPETVASADVRRMMAKALSLRLSTGYLLASAGMGESTTDLVMSGHGLLAENGVLLAEATPLSEEELVISEIDTELLSHRQARQDRSVSRALSVIPFVMDEKETALTRRFAANPFIPNDPTILTERCETILQIQARGLAQRMERAYAKKAVLGISGGLDSTLAVLVAARAMDLMKRPRTDIVAVTMPCFGTTSRTKNNATVLCQELGVDFRCVSIARSVELHFEDIGHDPSIHDVTYENCQARERTQVLMDIANGCGGMVIGTGDLSELALGWATYNGDHMSMYGVNGGVPKTLIRHVVAHCAAIAEEDGNAKLAEALRDVLDTPVSPELLPADKNGKIAQKTEDLVGPYEIHDFYIYHLLRNGFSPDKLYRIAKNALGDRYDDATLLKWLEILLRRFFAQQFKRSCLPDGPAIGSVTLSPRGGWAMPSDASSALWLAELEDLKKQ